MHPWDNGADADAELERMMDVRHEPIDAPSALDMPPGDPIGDPALTWLGGAPSGTPFVDLSCEWDRWW